MDSAKTLLALCLLAVAASGVQIQRPYRYNRQSSQQQGGLVRLEESSACITPKGENGTCIILHNCPPLVILLRNGNSSYLRKAICGYNGLEPNVCCPNPEAAVLSTSTTTSTTSTTTPVPFLPNIGIEEESSIKCGFSNVTHSRVVGGTESQLGAWPWLAALGYKNRDQTAGPKFLCGGALISAKHVLTAGHCVHHRKDLYMVRLGEHDLKNNNDGAFPIDIYIEDRVMHPKYNPTSYQNDIALLTLEYPVKSSLAIHPICLPDSQELRSMTFVRNYPFVAGWGAVKFNGPSSSTLRQVQLPVVEPARCKQAYSTFKTTVIDDKVMCAGFARGGKDACQGDSGGPLMWPRGDQYYIIGVVSYGFNCAQPGFPGVYTRVTAFLDWMEPLMQR